MFLADIAPNLGASRHNGGKQMHIDIRAREFPLTEALQQHAERRIRYALSRNDHRILRIVMQLSDVNGPRGGNDKRCHLRVVLNGMPELVAEDIEADMYMAINRATTKAGRSLARRMKRCIPKGRHISGSDTRQSDLPDPV